MATLLKITTLPVLDCLNSVQHLQPRCLEEDSSLIKTRKNKHRQKQDRFNTTVHISGSPNCGRMACTATAGPPEPTRSSPLIGVYLLAPEIPRKMTAQRCPCWLLVCKETVHKHARTVLRRISKKILRKPRSLMKPTRNAMECAVGLFPFTTCCRSSLATPTVSTNRNWKRSWRTRNVFSSFATLAKPIGDTASAAGLPYPSICLCADSSRPVLAKLERRWRVFVGSKRSSRTSLATTQRISITAHQHNKKPTTTTATNTNSATKTTTTTSNHQQPTTTNNHQQTNNKPTTNNKKLWMIWELVVCRWLSSLFCMSDGLVTRQNPQKQQQRQHTIIKLRPRTHPLPMRTPAHCRSQKAAATKRQQRRWHQTAWKIRRSVK